MYSLLIDPTFSHTSGSYATEGEFLKKNKNNNNNKEKKKKRIGHKHKIFRVIKQYKCMTSRQPRHCTVSREQTRSCRVVGGGRDCVSKNLINSIYCIVSVVHIPEGRNFDHRQSHLYNAPHRSFSDNTRHRCRNLLSVESPQ